MLITDLRVIGVIALVLLPMVLICQTVGSPVLRPSGQSVGSLNVNIDPRIELLCVIQYLAGSSMAHRDDLGYAAAADVWFSEWKSHPVYDMVMQMEEKGFSYDLPVTTFLRFDQVPLTRPVHHFDSYYQALTDLRWEDIEAAATLEDLIREVNSFYHQSDFAGFLASQTPLFEPMIDAAEALLAEEPDMIQHLEQWYGYGHNSFNLVMSPLLGPMGYGPATISEQGGMDVYCLMGFIPESMMATAVLNLSYMFFHEFSHSYVNPLIDEYYEELAELEHLYDPIAEKMSAQAYTTWWVCLAEHFVRATEISMRATYFQDYNVKTALAREIDRGFIYIGTIYDSVLKYEQARAETKINYRDFFPVIVQDFVSEAERLATEGEG